MTTRDGITNSEGTPISLEQWAAENAGYKVTVASGAEWEAMAPATFSKYQVLIVGDPICSSTAVSAVNSAATWTPVVMGTSGENPLVGNRVVIGTDPEYHYLNGGGGAQPTEPGNPASAGAEHLVQDGITFAGGVPGATGVYFDTSCTDLEEPVEEGEKGEEGGEGGEGSALATRPKARHDSIRPAIQEEIEGPDGRDVTDVLDHLTTEGPGHWTENTEPPCGGEVAQIAENPAFDTGPTALTDANIEGWECSVHVAFSAYPADWNALAVATDTEEKPICGTDPDTHEEACGDAYVLVAGRGVVAESELVLTPKASSNKAGGEHTVTATVTEGKTTPVVDAAVSFVVTGQNAGVSGTCTTTSGAADPTCVTDETGGVRFTYEDVNGAGEDTIDGSVTVNGSNEHATASETWEAEPPEPQPTSTSTMLSGGGMRGETLTVSDGTAVSDDASIAGANAAGAGGTVEYKIYSDPTCTNLVTSAGSVEVTAGVVPSSTPETLAPGTYYWVASYSGDASNQGSSSLCGAERLTVRATEPPTECTTAVGRAVFKIGQEVQRLTNSLSTDLAEPQHLTFSWGGKGAVEHLHLTKLTHAGCRVGHKAATFHGTGQAVFQGKKGYEIRFSISVETSGRVNVHLRLKLGKEVLERFADASLSTESVS